MLTRENQNNDPRTYAIIGAAIELHRVMGTGFLELRYKDAMGYGGRTICAFLALGMEEELSVPSVALGMKEELSVPSVALGMEEEHLCLLRPWV